MMKKKGPKTIKDLSESINRRRTDNTMVKRKKDNRINNDMQNTTQKTKD